MNLSHKMKLRYNTSLPFIKAENIKQSKTKFSLPRIDLLKTPTKKKRKF